MTASQVIWVLYLILLLLVVINILPDPVALLGFFAAYALDQIIPG